MVAIASDCASSLANDCSSVQPSLIVNISRTIFHGQSAVNMNVSRVMMPCTYNSSYLDFPDYLLIVYHMNEGPLLQLLKNS